MIISINQPAYLPWLGYFHRIAVSDMHIVLDSVQFEKNSFTNRNKARTAQGWCWLTVPVKTAGRFGELNIREVEIDNERPWAK
ncbi:MAG TPA: WbqC family protein, partial [Terriglobales bacterium]|nr:WbqC family protein [Terriglobales bacterium]